MEAKNQFTEDERRARAEASFWQTVGTLYRWRWFVVIITGVVAVSSVVISLLLPVWYRATSRVLIPQSSGTGLTALLGNIPSAAAFLGGGTGDYTRYLALLTSHTVLESVVQKFDLVHEYDLEDEDSPIDEAIRQLEDNVEFTVDLEYQYLSISAIDMDKQRAADISNYFVTQLNQVNNRLSTQSARQYRRTVERRYNAALASIDSLLDVTQKFQQDYGIYDLPTQTQTFFEQLGQLRARAVEAEIDYDVSRTQYGEENAQVESYQRLAEAANEKYNRALHGGEKLLPVSQSDVPRMSRTYINLELQRAIQSAILEALGPLYEQAKLQEQRNTDAVQIVDRATPPPRKYRPKRLIIVLIATFSTLVLASAYALTANWWKTAYPRYLEAIQSYEDSNDM